MGDEMAFEIDSWFSDLAPFSAAENEAVLTDKTAPSVEVSEIRNITTEEPWSPDFAPSLNVGRDLTLVSNHGVSYNWSSVEKWFLMRLFTAECRRSCRLWLHQNRSGDSRDPHQRLLAIRADGEKAEHGRARRTH